MKLKDFILAIGCIGLSFLAGAIGSLATIPNILSWYAALDKPPLLPPNWVFGPVWTVLYLLMGIALFLVIRAKTKESKRNAYYLFATQLVLNALWSIVFFGMHAPWAGFIVIIALLVVLGFTIKSFSTLSKTASLLLVPYIVWVSFATYLTIGVAVLNGS